MSSNFRRKRSFSEPGYRLAAKQNYVPQNSLRYQRVLWSPVPGFLRNLKNMKNPQISFRKVISKETFMGYTAISLNKENYGPP